MRSKLCAITARTPKSFVPLAAQSRDEPVPYSRPANTTNGNFLRLITHSGVIDRETLAGRLHECEAALNHIACLVLHHLVLDADVGEGAAHHHFVVAPPGAILIEVDRAHLMFDEILPSRDSRP